MESCSGGPIAARHGETRKRKMASSAREGFSLIEAFTQTWSGGYASGYDVKRDGISNHPTRASTQLGRPHGQIFAKHLAESTQRAYHCGQTKFLQFCEVGGFRAVPVTEATLSHI